MCARLLRGEEMPPPYCRWAARNAPGWYCGNGRMRLKREQDELKKWFCNILRDRLPKQHFREINPVIAAMMWSFSSRVLRYMRTSRRIVYRSER